MRTTMKWMWSMLLSLLVCCSALASSPLQQDDKGGDATQQDETQSDEETDAPKKPLTEKIKIGGETFTLEVAADYAKRSKGLSGRKEVAADKGMIFVYQRAKVLGFWMKDCLTDIDIMYLDARGRIVEAYEMTKEPPRGESESELAYEFRLKHYSSRTAALLAIELKPGTMKRLDLKKGQRITLDLAKLRRIVIEEERKERERERELERGETGGGEGDGDGGDGDRDTAT